MLKVRKVTEEFLDFCGSAATFFQGYYGSSNEFDTQSNVAQGVSEILFLTANLGLI